MDEPPFSLAFVMVKESFGVPDISMLSLSISFYLE